ncbi:SRPBCC family protein [Herbiconiux sp. P15]|uniref:SRPBCC family protein n=1 Tax=Herbiconiux liukaitaii TaxID=3342799 RepID=UPI0035B7BAF6
MTWNVQHLSQSIDATPAEVAAVAGDPAHLPRWAAGLSAGIRWEPTAPGGGGEAVAGPPDGSGGGGRWVAESPMGVVEVRFTGAVDEGILDHDVVLPDGSVTHNPLRILPNDGGSEVVFTLFQLPGTSDEAFAADARLVQADLARLAALFAPPSAAP